MPYEPNEIDLTVYSLVCERCDAGDDMHNEVDARAAGWTEIDYRPDLPMANFLGLCPDCRRYRDLADQVEGPGLDASVDVQPEDIQ
jgi:hypothetical protein